MAYEIGTQITCEYNILALKKASTAEANFENFYIVSNSSDIVGQCVPRRPGPTIQPRAFQLIFKVAQSLRKRRVFRQVLNWLVSLFPSE